MNIIARKPKDITNETITSETVVVDRGDGMLHRYVVATVTVESLNNNEWFWGTYFRGLSEAMAEFNSRGDR